MRVFLSWSGPVSKQIALALRSWLPKMIQAIEPWMSSEDIEKGARWSADIAKELNSTKAGIVCVTPDNLLAPWLNFEAGALSKTVEQEMVCTYLFRLKPSDITGPLVQFQASETTKEDTQKLLATLNKAIPKPLTESDLRDAFEMWWPQLESSLFAVPMTAPDRAARRSSEEMLSEVVDIVRDQARTNHAILAALARFESAGESAWPNGFNPINVFGIPSQSKGAPLLTSYSLLSDLNDSSRMSVDTSGMLHIPSIPPSDKKP